MNEAITIVVAARDRFTTTATCLRNIFKNTPQPFKVIAVLGGMPDHLQQELKTEFGETVRLIFEPGFLNGAQARNIALALIDTRLSVCLDTDVYVKPGWLEPLVEAQQKTGAALVSPLILDRQNCIHAAGNQLYIFKHGGKKYAQMELPFQGYPVCAGTNVKGGEIDFGEIHCQLIETETARTLKIYDENLREHHEMDSGLTLQKAGKIQFFEPRSKAYLYYPERIDRMEDLSLYLWKWDRPAMKESQDYFEKKWALDVNYRNYFMGYLYRTVDRRVGFFTRRVPSEKSMKLDLFLHKVKKTAKRTRAYSYLQRIFFD